MVKSPKDPKEIVNAVAEDYERVLGDDLKSVVLYGSAAGPDYRPGVSDLNLLLMLAS